MHMFRPYLFVGLVVAIAAPAVAQMSDEAARDATVAALGDTSPDGIIRMLVEDGRSLSDATALAISAAGDADARVKLARAGICAAQDTTQAEGVGSASLSVVEGDEQLARQVDMLVQTYATTACGQPSDRDWSAPPSMYITSDSGASAGTVIGVAAGGTSFPTAPTRPASPSN